MKYVVVGMNKESGKEEFKDFFDATNDKLAEMCADVIVEGKLKELDGSAQEVTAFVFEGGREIAQMPFRYVEGEGCGQTSITGWVRV